MSSSSFAFKDTCKKRRQHDLLPLKKSIFQHGVINYMWGILSWNFTDTFWGPETCITSCNKGHNTPCLMQSTYSCWYFPASGTYLLGLFGIEASFKTLPVTSLHSFNPMFNLRNYSFSDKTYGVEASILGDCLAGSLQKSCCYSKKKRFNNATVAQNIYQATCLPWVVYNTLY